MYINLTPKVTHAREGTSDAPVTQTQRVCHFGGHSFMQYVPQSDTRGSFRGHWVCCWSGLCLVGLESTFHRVVFVVNERGVIRVPCIVVAGVARGGFGVWEREEWRGARRLAPRVTLRDVLYKPYPQSDTQREREMASMGWACHVSPRALSAGSDVRPVSL